jgi:hypothetical protein
MLSFTLVVLILLHCACGAPLENCFGFIDVTVCPVCRPSKNQKQAFNGFKPVHAIIFQSIFSVNGLIVDLTGPWQCRRHVCGMLQESGLFERLDNIRENIENSYVYGDPAYQISAVVQTPYKGAPMTELEQEFNMKMSSVRISVEWYFGKSYVCFPLLTFRRTRNYTCNPSRKSTLSYTFEKYAHLFEWICYREGVWHRSSRPLGILEN